MTYGNTHSFQGKHLFVTSVSVKNCAVERVEFNINPGYAKPTASLTAPNGPKGAYEFEYAMARTYPNQITVKLKGAPSLKIDYTVVEETKFRRIVIEPPGAAAAKPRKPIAAEFDASDEPRNGWIRFQDGTSCAVAYMPEGACGSAAAV